MQKQGDIANSSLDHEHEYDKHLDTDEVQTDIEITNPELQELYGKLTVGGNQLAFATFEGFHFIGEIPFRTQQGCHH